MYSTSPAGRTGAQPLGSCHKNSSSTDHKRYNCFLRYTGITGYNGEKQDSEHTELPSLTGKGSGMKTKSLHVWRLVIIAAMASGMCVSCTPPYDASGSYTGYWSFVDNETKETIECPLTMELTQFPSDNMTVRGTVHVDYECLTETSGWPAAIPAPPASDVLVSGFIDPNGKLTLASGAVGPATIAILAFNGPGISENGVMVSYSGEWGFAFSFGFINLGGTGEFQVDRDP